MSKVLNIHNKAPYTAKCTLTYSADGTNTIPSPAVLDGQSWTPTVPEGATGIKLIVDPVGGRHPLTHALPNAASWPSTLALELHGTVNHPSIDG